MSENQELEKAGHYSLKAWEWNVLTLESVLLGAGLYALVSTMGPDRLASVLNVSEAVWQAIGFLVLMLCLYPILSIYMRSTRGTRLSFAKLLAWSVIGSVLGGVIFSFLR